jgi:hypothetical protein
MTTRTTHCTHPTPYAEGYRDGYHLACEQSSEYSRNAGGSPQLTPITARSGAEAWDGELINGIGRDEAKKAIGWRREGDWGRYNRGATAGYNARVRELDEGEE